MPFLQVTPSSQTVPILINDRPGCWDHPVKRVDLDKVEMHFIEFFDWNEFDYLDFTYYRVKIARLDGHPDVVGREALIERQYARVKFIEQ